MSQASNSDNHYAHASADVSPQAAIGANTRIWNWSQVREGAQIGDDCNIGTGVYIDCDVVIGNKVKIQNKVSVFEGVTIEDGVFVGPHVCFTNDLKPRAVNAGFELAGADDWTITRTLVKKGASIGANATIVAGVTIGEFAMVGAGSVVTKDIPAYRLAYGNPARIVAEINERGDIIKRLG